MIMTHVCWHIFDERYECIAEKSICAMLINHNRSLEIPLRSIDAIRNMCRHRQIICRMTR